MKIALTGPHCCGKSTVFRALSNQTEFKKKFRFVDYDGSKSPIDYRDTARLRSQPKLELDLTFWMVSDLIKREIEATQKSENVLLDRCVIDQLVYPSAILGKGAIPKEISDYVRSWVKHRPYNQVLLFPKNEELLTRFGRGDRNLEFLRRIEQRYREMLDEHQIPYKLLPISQEEQIKTIGEELRRLSK